MDRTYAAVTRCARLAFRALDLQITVTGAEHIPRTGPVVVAANHVSFLDFLLAGLPVTDRGRRLRFLARHDLWRPGLVGRALAAMGHVPVDRAAPAAAYLAARSHLRRGEAVGIFPEAGVSTSFTVRSLMPGAAALAMETGAPLVPLAIWGPQRILTAGQPRDLTRGRPISIAVGPPLLMPTDVDSATRRLGTTLQGMLDQLQLDARHRPQPGEQPRWHPAHLGGSAPTVAEARLGESVPRRAVVPTWLAADRLSSGFERRSR